MKGLLPRLRRRQTAVGAAARAAAAGVFEALESRTFFDSAPSLPVLEPVSPARRGDQQFFFTVDYSDDIAIDSGTIGDDDIVVTGPNGFSQVARFVGDPTALSDLPSVSAIYAINAPTPQGFGDAEAGTYTVSTAIGAGAVTDTRGNPVPGGVVGNFTLGFAAGADLTITDVSYAPGQYIDNGAVLIRANIRNIGAVATNSNVVFIVGLKSASSGNDELLDNVGIDDPIAPGDVVPVELSLRIPGGMSAGNYFLTTHVRVAQSINATGDVNPSNDDLVQPEADIVVAPFNLEVPAIGGLDPTFGEGGVVRQETGLQTTAAVALQEDGKTLAIGNSSGTSTSDFAVTRFNADGTIDTTFGGPAHGGPVAGTVFTDFGGRDDTPIALHVQADGKILVIGTSRAAGGTADADVALARYNSDGSLDTTFGTDGLVRTNVGPDGVVTTDIARGLWLMADGRFVICGQSNARGNGTDFLLLRYTTGGTLDSTFGDNGVVMTDFRGGNDTANALAIDRRTGTIVAVGSTTAPGDGPTAFAIARYTSTGALNTRFGDGGIVIKQIGKVDDEAFAVAFDRKMRVIAAGATADSEGTTTSFAVTRLSRRGVVDTSFGANGITQIDFLQPAVANQVTVDDEGNILVSGATVSSLSSIDPGLVSVALVQLQPSGQSDPKFGTAGFAAGASILNFDPNNSGPIFHPLATQPAVMSPAATQSEQALSVLATQHAIAVALGGQLVVVAAAGDQTAIGRVIGSGADVVSTVLTTMPNPTVRGVSRGSAILSLSNNGNRATAGKAVVSLLVSLDPALSDDDVPLQALPARTISLKPGQIKNYKAKFILPSDLPEGNYFVLGKVSTDAPQITAVNDNCSSLDPKFVAAPVVDLSGPPLAEAPTLAAGQKASITVTIKNDGNVTAKGAIEVKVLAASAAAPVAGDAVLADLPTLKINLVPGAQKTFKIKITVPTDLAAGSYFLLASVGGGIDASDPTPGNNLLASSTPLVIS